MGPRVDPKWTLQSKIHTKRVASARMHKHVAIIYAIIANVVLLYCMQRKLKVVIVNLYASLYYQMFLRLSISFQPSILIIVMFVDCCQMCFVTQLGVHCNMRTDTSRDAPFGVNRTSDGKTDAGSNVDHERDPSREHDRSFIGPS